MTDNHATVIVEVQRTSAPSWTIRGRCSCGWRGQRMHATSAPRAAYIRGLASEQCRAHEATSAREAVHA